MFGLVLDRFEKSVCFSFCLVIQLVDPVAKLECKITQQVGENETVLHALIRVILSLETEVGFKSSQFACSDVNIAATLIETVEQSLELGLQLRKRSRHDSLSMLITSLNLGFLMLPPGFPDAIGKVQHAGGDHSTSNKNRPIQAR